MLAGRAVAAARATGWVSRGDARRHFRLSAEAASKDGLRLTLIRHAESQNNVVQREAEERLRMGEINAEEATHQWLAGRIPDPPLSFKGEKESHHLSQFLSARLVRSGGAYLVTSPMLRAMQTTAPLARDTGYNVIIHPECYEVGGLYDSAKGGRALKVEGMTAEAIAAAFPGYHTHLLPSSGAWNAGHVSGKEDKGEWVARAERVAAWLKADMLAVAGGHQVAEAHNLDASRGDARSSSMPQSLVMVVCVLHSTFLDLLIKSLLDLPVTLPDTGAGFFHTDNTSISSLFLPAQWCQTGAGPGPTLLSLNSGPHIQTREP